jgi:dCMP deaminase
MANRKPWDHYFMDLAYMAATRATCPRRHVGAVLAKGKVLFATAYNGAPAGVQDCTEVGCQIQHYQELINGVLESKSKCLRALHAEVNLMLFSDRDERLGATVFVTDEPCWNCANMLANSGVVEIVYHRPYMKDHVQVINLLTQKGISIRQIESTYHAPEGVESKYID